MELDSPSLWSASIQPTRPHCRLASPSGFGNIHICCCRFRCSDTGNWFSKRKETTCLPLLKTGFKPRVSDTKSPVDCIPTANRKLPFSYIDILLQPGIQSFGTTYCVSFSLHGIQIQLTLSRILLHLNIVFGIKSNVSTSRALRIR